MNTLGAKTAPKALGYREEPKPKLNAKDRLRRKGMQREVGHGKIAQKANEII